MHKKRFAFFVTFFPGKGKTPPGCLAGTVKSEAYPAFFKKNGEKCAALAEKMHKNMCTVRTYVQMHKKSSNLDSVSVLYS